MYRLHSAFNQTGDPTLAPVPPANAQHSRLQSLEKRATAVLKAARAAGVLVVLEFLPDGTIRMLPEGSTPVPISDYDQWKVGENGSR